METAGVKEKAPLPTLNREAVAQLLAEGGDSNEYALCAHNRRIEVLSEHTCWAALPVSKTSGGSGGGFGGVPVPLLRTLDLSFNRLDRIGALCLAPLAELRALKLYANRLNDAGVDGCGLERLGRLERLELHDNRLTTPLSPALYHVFA